MNETDTLERREVDTLRTEKRISIHEISMQKVAVDPEHTDNRQ